MSEIIVRPAVVADAPGIAHVHVAAWREAYAQIFPAEFLASLDEQRRAASWARLIDSSETRVWAAELDGTIVGWITTGDGRDEDAPVDQELEGIYTLAAVHGSGAGQSLLDTALGASAAYLWVLEDNPRAQAFYRRNGFAPDGTRKPITIGGTTVTELRMVRSRSAG